MADKTTDELLHEIRQSDNVDDYLSTHDSELLVGDFCQYIARLLQQKGLVKADVIRGANLNRAYAALLLQTRH